MGHRLAVVLAAVVLSITIGVLVGLVIHTSRSVRANDVAPAPQSVTSARSITPLSNPIPSDTGQADPVPPDTVPSNTVPPNTGEGPDGASLASIPPSSQPVTSSQAPLSTTYPASTGTATSTTHPGRTTTTGTTPAAPSHGTTRTITADPPTTRTATSSSSPASTSPGVLTSSTVTAVPGKDVPDAPCAVLGAKSSTAAGVTVFCQHDQHDQSLRWRAVTNGGGCLNQTMTGIGADGKHYACRRGADGLNHWVRAR